MKPKLSICMMVKNEAQNLPRCLDSLQELREAVACELVVVDTGSTDDTVAIAQRYQAQIYHHSWNDNFSEMRNLTIKYAKGEWIFIIDADEEFTNAKPIIQFLHQKQPKAIGLATLLVKNLTNLNSSRQYSVLNSIRLFRNDGYFHYEGAIHNRPVFRGDAVATDAQLIHYGYDSADPELMERKFQRTSSILKRELLKEPDNIYYHFQLSVTYQMHKDNRESLDEIRQAFAILHRNRLKPKDFLYLYYQHAHCCLVNDLPAEAEKVCDEGIALEPEYIDLYFYRAQAQARQKKYRKATDDYLMYLKLVSSFDSLAVRHNPTLNHYSLGRADEASYNVMTLSYQSGDLKAALVYAEKIWSFVLTDKALIPNGCAIVADSALRLYKFADLIRFYRQAETAGFAQEMINAIEARKHQYPGPDLLPLYAVLAAGDTLYGKLNAIRQLYFSGKSQQARQLAADLGEKEDFNALPDYYGDIIYCLLKTDGPLERLCSKLTEENAVRYLKHLDAACGQTLPADVARFLAHFVPRGLAGLKTAKFLGKYLVFANRLTPQQIKAYYYEYLSAGVAYIEHIYNPQAIDGELYLEMKNIEEVFLLYCTLALRHRRDKIKCVQYLRKALEAYPDMKQGIEYLLADLQDDSQDQMAELKQQLIGQIRQLIDANQYATAAGVIGEYVKIAGHDLAMVDLQADIALQSHM